jgi:Ca2+-binding EF-hand superfamily protein
MNNLEFIQNNNENDLATGKRSNSNSCSNDKKQLDEFKQAFQTYDKENKGFVKINEFKHLTKTFFNKLTDTDLDLLVS